MLPGALVGLLATVVCILAIPVLLLRGKTRPGLFQRLGARPPVPRQGSRVWVHAASAGDVKNIWPVVRALREARPDVVVMLSYVTNSAAHMVPSLSPPPDVHAYVPLDAPVFVRRAFRRWQPALMLLEMTELWPSLLSELRRNNVPVALCNARMSARSFPRYQRLFAWLGNPVKDLAFVGAQTHKDRDRYLVLGAPAPLCVTTGNCKFDAAARTPSTEKVETLRALVAPKGPLLVAGSTHQGEEDVVLDALRAARMVEPQSRLLWAPRYLEHVDGIVAQVKAAGFSAQRRSGDAGTCATADVVVLDTMGELAAAYALGSVALVGGSFVPRGGQNILEPAAQGVPVLHGPHMFLAPDQVAVLDGHGAQQVTREAVASQVQALLRDVAAARDLGATGRAAVLGVAGAAAKHLPHVLVLLPKA